MQKNKMKLLALLLTASILLGVVQTVVFAVGADDGQSATTGSAQSSEGGAILISTEKELNTAFSEGGDYALAADIQLSATATVPQGVSVVLDLAGHKLEGALASSDKHVYAIDNLGSLTLNDSVGGAEINARGIYNGYNGGDFVSDAVMIINGGAFNGIDVNGGFAVGNYATLTVNGGTVSVWEDDPSDAAAAGNLDATALQNYGTVTLNGGVITSTTNFTYAVMSSTGNLIVPADSKVKVVGAHGAIYSGGNAEIRGGSFVCSGVEGQTDNVTFFGGGSSVISGGSFVHEGDKVGADSGAAVVVYGTDASLEISDGEFIGLSGAVSGNANTIVTGGSYSCVMNFDAWSDVSDYVTVGSVVCADGVVILKTEDGQTSYESLAKIGGEIYSDLDSAIKAANLLDGDVVVEIYGSLDYSSSTPNLTGSYDSITFVGKTSDAQIVLTRNGSAGYVSGNGNDCAVTWRDLILSKPEGSFANDAGFMNVAFTTYRVGSVAYLDCTFPNGATAAGCETVYERCVFNGSHDKYAVWAYGASVSISECVFDDDRGIKMFAEGAAKTTSLTVTDSDFSKLTNKPAIVLTYGESVTLDGNVYSSTGTLELDLGGSPDGTAVITDGEESLVCVNDDGACGVLVNGYIYTTVADAAAVAKSGDTVTLLHSSSEEVELSEGVVLDLNGYTADGVSVATPEPSGTLTRAYTSENTYWGECGGNAKESFEFKLYNDELYMGYTSLNNIGGILNGNVYVSWNIKLDAESNTDEYWTMAWEVAPTVQIQPNRVEQWVDGVKVAECAIEPNWSDALFPVVAALTDAEGKILSYVNNRGTNTLANAFSVGGNLVMLDDATFSASPSVDAELNLDLNGHSLGVSSDDVNLDVYGKLTVNDSVGTGTSTFRNHFVRTGGELVLNGGSLRNIASLTAGFALNLSEENATATINGGSVCALNRSNYAVKVGANSILTVNGGSVEGNFGCIHNAGSVLIKGGSFTVTGDVGGHCLYAYMGSVVIENGDFLPYNVNTSCSSYSVYVEGNASVSISGGSFGADVYGRALGAASDSEASITVSGGSFDSDVTKFLAEGYTCSAVKDSSSYLVHNYFEFDSASLRIEGDGTTASLRFAFDFNDELDMSKVQWTWSYQLGSKGPSGTVKGVNLGADNMTSVVFTGIETVNYNSYIYVTLTVEIDGVTVLVDLTHSCSVVSAATAIVNDQSASTEAKEYANLLLEKAAATI